MSDDLINPSGLPCFALGMTDGLQCEIMRRKGKKVKKPSGADDAKGEHTTKDGLAYGSYWICHSAMLYFAHRGDGTVSMENTVKLQESCDSFMARR